MSAHVAASIASRAAPMETMREPDAPRAVRRTSVPGLRPISRRRSTAFESALTART